MKRGSIAATLVVSLLVSVLVGGVMPAAAAPPAEANVPFTTSDQVQAAIESAIASVQAALDELESRVEVAEATVADHEARIDTLENAGGSAGQSGLGPVTDITVDVRIEAYANLWQPDQYWHVAPVITTSVPAGTIPGFDGVAAGVPTEAIVVCTMGGITKANLAQGGYGPMLSQTDGVPRLPAGSPIEARALTYKAEMLRRRNDWEGAATVLTSIFDKFPESEIGRKAVLVAVGLYREKLGRPDLADSLVTALRSGLITAEPVAR